MSRLAASNYRPSRERALSGWEPDGWGAVLFGYYRDRDAVSPVDLAWPDNLGCAVRLPTRRRGEDSEDPVAGYEVVVSRQLQATLARWKAPGSSTVLVVRVLYTVAAALHAGLSLAEVDALAAVAPVRGQAHTDLLDAFLDPYSLALVRGFRDALSSGELYTLASLLVSDLRGKA